MPTCGAVDIGLTLQTPVYAAYDGIVEAVYNAGIDHDFGTYVMIKHFYNGSNYYSLYAHLTQYSAVVTPTQYVVRGQFLGLSGNIGKGPIHLHFGITKEVGAGQYQGVNLQYYTGLNWINPANPDAGC